MAIPIFVISFNRYESLVKSLTSYIDCFGDGVEIIICDNGSDYSPLVNFLNNPPGYISKVYFNRKIKGVGDMVRLVQSNIEDYFLSRAACNYIVTDPDIVLDNVDPGMLDFYQFVLKVTDAEVVGPMLRIDDIPNHYPKKKFVIRKHYDFFWSRIPGVISYKGVNYHLLRTSIDTTFAMHRAGERFDRLKKGFRTYAPFMARHIDWYLNWQEAGEEFQQYGDTAAPNVSHFSVYQGFLSIIIDEIRYAKQKLARYLRSINKRGKS